MLIELATMLLSCVAVVILVWSWISCKVCFSLSGWCRCIQHCLKLPSLVLGPLHILAGCHARSADCLAALPSHLRKVSEKSQCVYSCFKHSAGVHGRHNHGNPGDRILCGEDWASHYVDHHGRSQDNTTMLLQKPCGEAPSNAASSLANQTARGYCPRKDMERGSSPWLAAKSPA